MASNADILLARDKHGCMEGYIIECSVKTKNDDCQQKSIQASHQH